MTQSQPSSKEAESGTVASQAKESQPESKLARQISGWTSNFLATAVVVILALVVGRQLVSYWSDNDDGNVARSETVDAWPILESCALEFGDSPYRMQRTQITTTEQGALKSLTQRCRELLQNKTPPAGPVSQAELKMIETSNDLKPIAQEDGKWRIYSVDQSVSGQTMPTVLGIRDNLIGADNQSKSRLVAWGMALKGESLELPKNPADKDLKTTPDVRALEVKPNLPDAATWTTYVCHTAVENEANQIPVPESSRRTMSIADTRGAKLIGFSGGSPDDAKRFYDDWSIDHDWNQVAPWRQVSNAWAASFEPSKVAKQRDARLWKRVQIRLSNDMKQTRGLITVTPMAGSPTNQAKQSKHLD